MWNASLKPELHLSEESIARLAELTSDFSFAYLKELFLSSMMRWISRQQESTMEQVMESQVSVLHEQMVSANTRAAKERTEDAEQGIPSGMIPRRVIRRWSL